MTDSRIALARDLFAAWSSGDADAPGAYFHPDGVLYDIVGGEHKGWPAIRAYFGKGLEAWPDLELIPERYWTSEDGVALSWVMSATVTDAGLARVDPVHIGKRWRSEGMTWLLIADGLVTREVDYRDGGAVTRSLDAQGAS